MSQRFTFRWLAIAVAAAILSATACSSRPSKSEEKKPDDQTAQPPNKQDDKKPPEQPKDKQPDIQAENEQWRKIAEEAMKGRTVGEQQSIAESEKHYELAMAYYRKGEFEKARIEAQAAVEKWHENLPARDLLNKVNSLLIGRPEGFGATSTADERIQEIRVKVQQAELEITNHIRTGERYYNARLYDEAVREFEEADFKIKHIPYEVKEMKNLEPKVESYIRKAKDASATEKARVMDMKRKEADSESAAHEFAMRREVTHKIANLLELSYMAFDQQKFDRCIRLCNEILLIDPHYTVATELKEDAEKARHRVEYYNFLKKKIDAWKQLTNADDEASIPYSETVRFPTRAEWAEISRRIEKQVIQTQEGVGEEDPDILVMQHKLDTMKIDMSFESNKLEDIIAFVRDFTGLNIIIDASVRDKGVDIEKAITFKVKDLVLRNVMKLLLNQYNLDYHITEQKVILITTPEGAHGKVTLELHDIRDILVKVQDFAGPKVELTSPTGGGGGTPLTGATFSLEEPKEASVSQEQIVELIKENIGGPSNWEGEFTIDLTPNHQLLVNHTLKTHREIRDFLTKLRSYTGTMVSVTARFMQAFDDTLDDLGVDIIHRGVGPDGAWPGAVGFDVPNSGLTDIDEQAVQLGAAGVNSGPGFISQETARLQAWDVRAQSFNTLLKRDALTGIGVDPMSNRIRDQGGLGLQYQWIGEQLLQAVLRAVHKQQKATIVQAPRITVFNTQRSHIMALTQIPYIQDVNPVVSTLAAAYEPVIGILTQGVVLDVRPIVSNDRRYVTLELRPSLAELQVMRNLVINTGQQLNQAQLQTANATIVQLPWLILQKAETTVTIPDRGTLLISGFRDILMRDMHTGVPFLENIPVLNFFFTRKGKSNERRRLMILVTPEIIDLAEHEEKNF